MIASAVAAMALVAPASQADTPAPGYGQFAGCPTAAEFPGVAVCTAGVIKGGHFQMGSKDVPIEKPIKMSGGQLENGFIVANSKGGLEAVKQKVPGGVIGLTGLTWLLEFLGSEALTLYAVTELVGPPQITGTGLNLPLRVHLINSVLGNNCYVGSASTPIKLTLINGTTSPPPPNKPITGKNPEFGFDAATEIISIKNGVFVDNSFAAPGASGCVLTLFGFIPISINGLVNSQSGLPAPAGTNETTQNLDLEIAPTKKVYP
ncbi:MAG TPA: hypothetical protein VFR04_03355 [Solirubrobacterales bacterium]|nr:hypothetical protein [Solirubrobacterales bacterium]